MPWARREGGSIVALYSQEQPGLAEELLPEDDPDVIAFRNPPQDSAADQVEKRIVSDPALIALVRRAAKAEGVTEREMLDAIRAEARAV